MEYLYFPKNSRVSQHYYGLKYQPTRVPVEIPSISHTRCVSGMWVELAYLIIDWAFKMREIFICNFSSP